MTVSNHLLITGRTGCSTSCRLSGQRLRRSRLCCFRAARGFKKPGYTTLGHVGLVRTLACWKLRLRSACIVRIVSAATLVVVEVITLLIGGIAKLRSGCSFWLRGLLWRHLA